MRQQIMLITVLVAAFYSTISTYLRHESVPSRTAWTQVVQELANGLKSGDAVTWLPEWAEEGRVSLKAIEHTTEIIYPPHHGFWDLARFRRVWVISAYGMTGRQLVEQSKLSIEEKHRHLNDLVIPMQPLKLMGERKRGALTLTLIEPQGESVVADLYSELSQAERVKVLRSPLLSAKQSINNKPSTPCSIWALNGWHCTVNRAHLIQTLRTSNSTKLLNFKILDNQHLVKSCIDRPQHERHETRSKNRSLYTLDRRRHLSYVDCGLHPEEHISRDIRVIGGEPRRCVWIRPHQDHALVLHWEIPHQPQALIFFNYGWEDLAIDPPFRRSHAQALSVTLSSENHEILNLELQPQWGWQHQSIALPDLAQVQNKNLTLQIQAPQDVKDAHLCFDLSIRQTRSMR